MNIWQITQHILPRAESECSVYVAKRHILPKPAIDGSLCTLKEFTILEFTALGVEIVCSSGVKVTFILYLHKSK